VVFLLSGTRAPAGWSLIGSDVEVINAGGGRRNQQLKLDIYRKI